MSRSRLKNINSLFLSKLPTVSTERSFFDYNYSLSTLLDFYMKSNHLQQASFVTIRKNSNNFSNNTYAHHILLNKHNVAFFYKNHSSFYKNNHDFGLFFLSNIGNFLSFSSYSKSILSSKKIKSPCTLHSIRIGLDFLLC